MINNLNRFIIPNVAGPAKLVPLAALVDSDLSLVALRAAAQRGRLDAHQRSDGQWLSTCKAVNEYRTRRSRPPGSHEEPSQVATPKPSLTDPSPSPPSGARQRERHNLRAKVDSLRAAQY